MITAGTKVIHKPTRRVGTVVRLLDYSNAIRYSKNSQAPRALVDWGGGKHSRMLVSVLTVADEQALEANRQAIQADRIAHWRREVAALDRAIQSYEERGQEQYAAHDRDRRERYLLKLREAGAL